MRNFLQPYVFLIEENDRNVRKKIREAFLYKLIRIHSGKETERMPIRIETGPKGKPYLSFPENLHFNISDSGDHTVVAIASLPIGVDIETIRPRTAALSPERWFSEVEIGLSRNCASETYSDPNTGFIRLWTCKESLLKQIGCGLGSEMKSHPVLSRIENGKRIPYAQNDGIQLLFTSFLIQNGHIGNFSSRSARCGDLILSICHPEKLRNECRTPIFLPADFPFPGERNR